jgi:hypothetical protein
MENNKYYTPEISEFRVGFKCERKEASDLEWKQCIVEPSLWSSNAMWSYIKGEQSFRVKYLDKEDIESLGFKYDNNAEPIPSRQNWEVPKLNEFELPIAFLKDTQDIDGKGWFLYLYKDHTIWIEYIKDCCGMGYLFKGTIKNKFELEVLLKQLGI